MESDSLASAAQDFHRKDPRNESAKTSESSCLPTDLVHAVCCGDIVILRSLSCALPARVRQPGRRHSSGRRRGHFAGSHSAALGSSGS